MKIEDAKILVVDDDDVMRKFVVTLLTRLGAEQILVADSGRSGLEVAQGFLPDLIITDVHMQPINGLDFIRGLRSHTVRELRVMPVLMLSVDTSSQTLHESIPLGISGYVVKPPNLASMKRKVEECLKEPIPFSAPVLHG